MSKRSKDLILLILDMQGIEDRLREFERKYRLRSSEFYRLVTEGKIEQRLELLEWLGLLAKTQRWGERATPPQPLGAQWTMDLSVAKAALPICTRLAPESQRRRRRS